MKIFQINSNNYKNIFKIKQSRHFNTKINSLKTDIVSFKSVKQEEIPKDIQLYRCIGEEEYQSLLNGNKIKSSGFVTSDAKGWHATDWHDGFKSQSQAFDSYFITFKKGRFKNIQDKRISIGKCSDSRYRIDEEYSLEDIDNIRQGFNTHGKIVWAENLEEKIRQDTELKKREISRLIDIIKNQYKNSSRKVVINELGSYAREFPEIIKEIERYIDFEKEEDVNDFAYLINKADNGQYLPEYRRCINAYLNGIWANSNLFIFLSRHGGKEDLSFVLDLLDKETIIKSPQTVCSALNSVANKDDYEEIFERLNKDDINNIAILLQYTIEGDENGEHIEDIKKILLNCYRLYLNNCTGKYLIYDGIFSLSAVVNKCLEYMEKYANDEESINIIKLFCSNEKQYLFYNRARKALAKLK